MTLAIQAIKSVLEFAEENEIHKIDTVVLEIGELSLVIPEYMEDSYHAAVKGTLLEDSKLKIELIPGNCVCLGCGRAYNLLEHKGVCPKCGSGEKDILSGQEFNIKELLVPEEE
ncbi:MAG: hydrogenase maturation nickel metallochaperone HypA [Oscillospiraceae bacterium]